jgi:ABC-type uncharacterized transport system permease subunit
VEIALIWGLIFALIMQSQTDTLDSDRIIIAVLIVAVGTALTRILAYIYKTPGIPFRFNFERGVKKSKEL